MLLVSRGDGSEILKVLDFDLSPVRDATAPPPNLFPLHRRPRGSHAYLAPERALDPGVVDLRADVWSLGAVLFFLVTGAPPYAEGTAAEVLGAIAARSPEALRVRLRDIPGPLADAILRCLEPDRDRRFSDVSELGEALVPYGTGARTAGARRAREALSRPPPSFLTTMPLQVIPAAPPPPAPSAPAEMPGFGHRTLAFTPTPQAMPIPVMPPHVMATLPFSVPAMAPAPPVARTSGPSGAMVAIVGGLLTVAIGGAIAGVLLSRPRDAVVMDPPPAETTSTSAASPPPLETAAAVPEPTEEPTAAPSSTPPAAVSAAAAAETPSTPITPVTPVTMPASRRPSKSELLRSRE
jgi:serine/threonine-protein kinase